MYINGKLKILSCNYKQTHELENLCIFRNAEVLKNDMPLKTDNIPKYL